MIVSVNGLHWLVATPLESLLLLSHHFFLCVSVLFSMPLIRTPAIGLRVHLDNPGWSLFNIFNWSTSSKTLFPKTVAFIGSKILPIWGKHLLVEDFSASHRWKCALWMSVWLWLYWSLGDGVGSKAGRALKNCWEFSITLSSLTLILKAPNF